MDSKRFISNVFGDANFVFNITLYMY